MTKYFSAVLSFTLVCAVNTGVAKEDATSTKPNYIVTERASGLKHPWGLAFLPNGDLLITERAGNLRRLDTKNRLSGPISGLPEAVVRGQGGMLGIAIHPDFEKNSLVYVCLNVAGEGGWGSEVHAGKLQGDKLVDTKRIFAAQPKVETGYHFGCRIVFDNNKDLFISLGDRGSKKELAQDLNTHFGKVIKLKADGSIPSDNPFVGKPGKDDIFSYGHRNVQGMTKHPETGKIWAHEHGPKGGDEVNILSAGNNYGWPVISYGINYDGTIITDKTAMKGMEQPLTYYVPSIAPSGMSFYTGDMFSDWQGDLLIGSLSFRYLARVELDEHNKVIAQHKMLEDREERIRDVVQAPDGSIYVLTDDGNGKVLRISAMP